MTERFDELLDFEEGVSGSRVDGLSPPEVSVVVPTFGRPDSLRALLLGLEGQDLGSDRFEVIVVDDGSPTPTDTLIESRSVPYRLRVLRQENAGPAAARNRGARQAKGELLVFVDDDMRVSPGFLRAHVAAHGAHTRRVVLGRMAPDPRLLTMPLFERFHAAMLEEFEAAVAAGTAIRGIQVYSGNLSVRRATFWEAGGFDEALRRSEDRELGVRLEKLGCELLLSTQAETIHASDHTAEAVWLDRGRSYGRSDTEISRRHPEVESADPWRFLFLVSPASRIPLLLISLAPRSARPVSRAALVTGHVLDALHVLAPQRMGETLSSAIRAGTTFAFGVEYFAGVGLEAGSPRRALDGMRQYLEKRARHSRDTASNVLRMFEQLRADREAYLDYRAKYRDPTAGEEPATSLASDVVERIGIQMCAAIRLMGCLDASGHATSARLVSRLMRHIYGAEIHWKAEIDPGLVIVHGNGLVIGHGARVGRRCILFHNVTLGEGRDARTREVGSPTLGDEVHVGPGACLIGPISVAAKSKIAPGTVLMHSIPAAAVVSTSEPRTVLRPTAEPETTEGAA